MEELTQCIEATREPYNKRLEECQKLGTHDERMACVGDANPALMKEEGECFRAFEGE